MTSELKPLIDDQSQPGYLREMMRQARAQEGPNYDLRAGLARHRAVIASGAPMPDWMRPSVQSTLKTGELITRLVGIATVPVVMGGAMWGVWTLLGQPASPKNTTPAVIAAPAETAEAKKDRAVASPQSQESDQAKDPVVSLKEPLIVQAQSPALRERAVSPRPKRPAESAAKAPERQSAQRTAANAQPNPEEQSAAPYQALTPGAAAPRLPLRVVPGSPSNSNADIAPVASASSATPPSAPTPPTADSILRRELALLAQARRFVDTSPRAALRLAQDTASKSGLLNEEWDQVQLLSLVKLGRVEEARQGANNFQSRYPHSAFNERIRKQLSSNAK